jgi:molybdopterin synthase sulfur carrier subunit
VAEVLVRYFAAAAESAGVEEERVLVEPATVGRLQEDLIARHGPGMARVLRNGSFLVDGVVSRRPEQALGVQVDVLPPFAGG